MSSVLGSGSGNGTVPPSSLGGGSPVPLLELVDDDSSPMSSPDSDAALVVVAELVSAVDDSLAAGRLAARVSTRKAKPGCGTKPVRWSSG